MLRFLLNLSITPLPAKAINELYAAFLTEFVYYSLTSWRIKWILCFVSYWICLLLPYQLKNYMNFMLRFIPNYVCHLLACTPEEDLCEFISKVVSCVSSPFPKIGVKFRTKFVIRILLYIR